MTVWLLFYIIFKASFNIVNNFMNMRRKHLEEQQQISVFMESIGVKGLPTNDGLKKKLYSTSKFLLKKFVFGRFS